MRQVSHWADPPFQIPTPVQGGGAITAEGRVPGVRLHTLIDAIGRRNARWASRRNGELAHYLE